MDAEKLYKEIMENAQEKINRLEKAYKDRGLLVEKPMCAWQHEWHIRFECMKQEILLDANKMFFNATKNLKEPPEIKIEWVYSGETKRYHITLNGEQVHFTTSVYERDMFITELKAKIINGGVASV